MSQKSLPVFHSLKVLLVPWLDSGDGTLETVPCYYAQIFTNSDFMQDAGPAKGVKTQNISASSRTVFSMVRDQQEVGQGVWDVYFFL